VSTQILAEFYTITTRRIKALLTHSQAYKQLEFLAYSLHVCEINTTIILAAALATHEHQMHYWDAQIWATARLYQIPYVLTEDIPGREYLKGVHYINPFLPDFDLSSLELNVFRS
jgi:predicted nucleic acid-binding protein